jgi:hypothetical protein
MHKLVILIQELEDPSPLEDGWPQFLHWAEQMPGLQREVTSRVSQTLFGDVTYRLVHELIFTDAQSAYNALSSPEGQAAGRTLQSITNGRVTLFFADHMEDTIENIQKTSEHDTLEQEEENA